MFHSVIRKLAAAFVAVVLCSQVANAATGQCTLIWQSPQQHLDGNPPPAPVNVTGSVNYQLSISCPTGVTAPTSYQIWGGCMDSGAPVPTGYTNVYKNPDGSCQNSPLANGQTNGGVPVSATVQNGTVSFNFDVTQYFPQSSIEDINVSSLFDTTTNSYDAATPRDCPPNGDCDIAVTVGPPASTPTPTATPTPGPTNTIIITSPVANSNVTGTITVSAINNPSTDYLKWYLPKAANGTCPLPTKLDRQGNCSTYTGGNGSFQFNTSQLSNGTSNVFVQEFNPSTNHLDASASVSYTIGAPPPAVCTITFTNPQPNAVVSGKIDVQVAATGCPSGDYVKWYLPDGTNSYVYPDLTFDTTTVANGANTFGAQVFTSAQVYTGVNAWVPITINNVSATPTPTPTATPTPTLSTNLYRTMGADYRIVSDQSAYGPDTNSAEVTGASMLSYLGLSAYRTDFTCDNAQFAGCDTRNLISTYFNTLPYDWVILPFTSGALDLNSITGFQIPTMQRYIHVRALEDGNEINNDCSPTGGPGFTYAGVAGSCSGASTWAGGASWSHDWYTNVKSAFGSSMPVFSWSNPAFEPVDNGLQYAGSTTTPTGKTLIADYADTHPYPSFSGSVPPDGVVATALETGAGGPDNGMTGNFCGTTVTGGFPTYGSSSTLCAQIPRVITEFGIQFTKTTEEQKAAIDTNFYVLAYLKGWTTFNSLYAVADDTTGFGIFASQSAGQTATSFAVHNLSTWLKASGLNGGQTTCPSISGNAQSTDYAICGTNWMLATGDRPSGEHVETWTMSSVPGTAAWTDMVTGATGTGNSITVDDHLVGIRW